LLRQGDLRLFRGHSGFDIGRVHAYHDMQILGGKGSFACQSGQSQFLQGVSQSARAQGTPRKAEKDEDKGGICKK
jgi:hypothetical protein